MCQEDQASLSVPVQVGRSLRVLLLRVPSFDIEEPEVTFGGRSLGDMALDHRHIYWTFGYCFPQAWRPNSAPGLCHACIFLSYLCNRACGLVKLGSNAIYPMMLLTFTVSARTLSVALFACLVTLIASTGDPLHPLPRIGSMDEICC